MKISTRNILFLIASVSLFQILLSNTNTHLTYAEELDFSTKVNSDSQKIQCQNGLIQIIKISDGMHTCVFPKSSEKLVDRGWGIIPENSTKAIPKLEEDEIDKDIKKSVKLNEINGKILLLLDDLNIKKEILLTDKITIESEKFSEFQKLIEQRSMLSPNEQQTSIVDSFNQKIREANVFYHNGNYSTSIKYYDQLTSHGYNYSETIENASVVLFKLGESKRALELSDISYKIKQNDLDESIFSMQTLLEKEQYEEAEILVDEILKIIPDDYFVLHNKGIILSNQGQDKLALEFIDKALETKPDSLSALTNKAIMLYNLDRHTESDEILNKVLGTDPENYLAIVMKGYVEYYAGRNAQESVKWFDKALEINPEDPYVLSTKAHVLIRGGLGTQWGDPLHLYKQALEIDPNYFLALKGMGLVFNLDDKIEAIKWYKKAVDVQPDSYDVMNTIGELSYKIGNTDEALLWFDRSLEEKPDHLKALQGKAKILFELEMYEEAIEVYDKALKKKPYDGPLLTGKGNALFELEMYEEAIEVYDKALEDRIFHHKEAHENRKTALEKLNDVSN